MKMKKLAWMLCLIPATVSAQTAAPAPTTTHKHYEKSPEADKPAPTGTLLATIPRQP